MEPLEGRLTPAPAPPFVPAPIPFGLPLALEQGFPALEQNLSALERGLETALQRGSLNDLRLLVNHFKTRETIDSARPLINHPSERIRLGNHPIRAALAASADGSRWASLGDGLLRSELNGLMAAPTAVPLAQGFPAATMILVHNESSTSASGFSASSPALSSPGDIVGLPTRLPFLAETLGFSPFNSLALMRPAKDRSIVFELSPYAPAGLDIVPIPVPRGMDDWFAELFGNPPKGPEPGAWPGNMPGASDDSAAALRDAVLQMLHGSEAPQSFSVAAPPMPYSPRLAGGTAPLRQDGGHVRVPLPSAPAATDKAFQVDSSPEAPSDDKAAKPTAKLTAASVLGLFAAGMGQAIRHRGRRRRSNG